MTIPIDLHHEETARLCRRYGVRRLELFGSAATEKFDPARSDLDFILEFDSSQTDLFNRYFGLKESSKHCTDAMSTW